MARPRFLAQLTRDGQLRDLKGEVLDLLRFEVRAGWGPGRGRALSRRHTA